MLSNKATDLQLEKQCEEVQLFRNRVDLHDKESVRVAARNKREVSRLQREIAMSKEETAEQTSHAVAQRAICRKQQRHSARPQRPVGMCAGGKQLFV